MAERCVLSLVSCKSFFTVAAIPTSSQPAGVEENELRCCHSMSLLVVTVCRSFSGICQILAGEKTGAATLGVRAARLKRLRSEPFGTIGRSNRDGLYEDVRCG